MPLSPPIYATKPRSWIKPRKNIREISLDDALKDLKASISISGILNPLIALDDGTLVCGYRRLACLDELQITEIPVSIYPASTPELDILAMQMIENEQREDMTDVERFRGCEAMEACGASRTEIARRLGTSNATVTRSMAPADCIDDVKAAFFAGLISAGDCYQIKGANDQAAALRDKLNGASRADIDRKIKRAKSGEGSARTSKVKIHLVTESISGTVTVAAASIDLDDTEDYLKEALRLVRKAKDQKLDCRTAQLFWRDVASNN